MLSPSYKLIITVYIIHFCKCKFNRNHLFLLVILVSGCKLTYNYVKLKSHYKDIFKRTLSILLTSVLFSYIVSKLNGLWWTSIFSYLRKCIVCKWYIFKTETTLDTSVTYTYYYILWLLSTVYALSPNSRKKSVIFESQSFKVVDRRRGDKCIIIGFKIMRNSIYFSSSKYTYFS